MVASSAQRTSCLACPERFSARVRVGSARQQRRGAGPGQVRHAEYEAEVAHGGARPEDRPSDHRPVSAQLEVWLFRTDWR